jgi:hypothetical protein
MKLSLNILENISHKAKAVPLHAIKAPGGEEM